MKTPTLEPTMPSSRSPLSFAVRVRHALERFVLARAFVPVVIAAALLLRIAWVVAYPADPVSDFHYHQLVATNLVDGYGYRQNPTAPLSAFRPPGYPLMLAGVYKVFGNHLAAARALNIVLQMGTIVLVYLLARRLFRSEITGRMALFIFGFFPSQIGWVGLLASENALTFLMVLGVALVVLPERSPITDLGSGVAFGVAALIKPLAIVTPVLLLIAYLPRSEPKRRLRDHVLRAAVISLIAVVTITPWMIRNKIVFGRLIYATEGGLALLQGNNPYSRGEYLFDARVRSLIGLTHNELVDNDRAQAYALDYIRKHPGRFVSLFPRKIYLTYWPDDQQLAWTIRGVRNTNRPVRPGLGTFIGISDVYYLVVLSMFLVSVPFLWIRSRWRDLPRFSSLPFAVVIVSTIFYLPFVGFARYHVPFTPWIVMYSAALIAVLLGEGRQGIQAPRRDPAAFAPSGSEGRASG